MYIVNGYEAMNGYGGFCGEAVVFPMAPTLLPIPRPHS